VASKEGRLIYALVPEQHSVLIIDTTTLNETRAISVGRTPALSLVAP
jgi:YVTN family beta-propeller protein